MKAKKVIISTIAVVSLLMTSAFTVSADETAEPAGYVTMTAEKFVLGQGFVKEPQRVPFYMGESGVDITKRFLENENINAGKGLTSSSSDYVSSIADNGSEEADIPQYISDAVTALGKGKIENKRSMNGWLNAGDYYTPSGWIYVVNNKPSSSGISGYKPVDGDVLRYEFTIYGYGSDIGIDNSSWGGSESLTPAADRDDLYEIMADAKDAVKSDADLKKAYNKAVSEVYDLKAEQDKINKAYTDFKAAYDEANLTSTVTTTVSDTTTTTAAVTSAATTTSVTTASTTAKATTTTTKAGKSPNTGDKAISALIISAGAAAVTAGIIAKKRRK